MTKHEIIQAKIESLTINMIGSKRLSILSISEEMGQSIVDVRQVVQNMITEGKLRFDRGIINESSKTYDREYLQIIKQRKIVPKTNYLYPKNK